MSSSGGSGRFFQPRRITSSASHPHHQPAAEDAAGTSALSRGIRSPSTAKHRLPRTSRAYSVTSGASALPTRSYVHNSMHPSNDAQYASEGVREQTAELSSSFMSESEMHRRLEQDQPEDDLLPTGTLRRPRHESIDEHAELELPEPLGSPPGPPAASTSSLSRWTNDSSSLYTDDRSMTDSLAAAAAAPQSLRDHLSGRGGSGSDSSPGRVPNLIVTDDDEEERYPVSMHETTPLLLPRERLPAQRQQHQQQQQHHHHHQQQQQRYDGAHTLERQSHPAAKGSWSSRMRGALAGWWSGKDGSAGGMGVVRDVLASKRRWDARSVFRATVLRPGSMLPSVFLGVLLNLLDALSYGIILFPLGEDIFSSLGADGVSMFYVSCIVSQLVYSTGSIFRGGVGSEMIEVVPFFHKMTYMILGIMGRDNPDAVRATVITSYAMSSILTGIVFFVLGSARLGTLVNFFPHSILVGCIGGVGIFLFLTGIEVSARLDSFRFSKDVFSQLIQPHSLAQWLPPLALAVILMVIKRFYDRPFLVPAYYIIITAVFYIVTVAVPSLTMEVLRSTGWVFEAPEAGVAFYNFYSYYQFNLVNWKAVAETIPSQFALTFFGILHVPINVPNLAMKMQEDNVNINRELIMHGISNTLSGCVGSIQNYLVYVNSVLFMDTGGDSRLAGYMLAAATFGLWVAGPVVIGYVPVMVVGTLIYYLGIDLAKEALFDTYGRLHKLEYLTILVIALVMGIYDFVVGVAVGIGLACLVYVVQTSRKTVIRAQFSGAIAGSTVRRHPRQRAYLQRVGPQVRIVKLGGYLFFGSIVNVEKAVRALIDAEAFAASPIRFLVLDFSHVTGIDFSAAEAFGRMNRVLRRRDVEMILAGVNLNDEVGRSLQMDGLFVAEEEGSDSAMPVPKVYEDLNGTLEACENSLLVTLTEKQEDLSVSGGGGGDGGGTLTTAAFQDSDVTPVKIPAQPRRISPPRMGLNALQGSGGMVGSPRTTLRNQAATRTLHEQAAHERPRGHALKQPLPLLLHAFQNLTSRNEDFWFRAAPYFARREFARGARLYAQRDPPNGFYLLQAGILRAEYSLEQGAYYESIVAGTTCGELPFFSDTERTSGVVAEQDCVAWLLTPERWAALQRDDVEVAQELLKVGLKLSAERMSAVTSYVLITAS